MLGKPRKFIFIIKILVRVSVNQKKVELVKKTLDHFNMIIKKMRILTRFLGLFGPEITINILKNCIILINSTRAFDWCMNCVIWLRIFFYQFLVYGRTLSKTNRKIFPQLDNTIHTPIESPCRVDELCSIFLMFIVISGQKGLKTVLKYAFS
jgi:hypothetical protein